MEQQIKFYRDFLRAELSALVSLAPSARAARARALLGRHRLKIADFQHERLIHLLVTLSFAFILLALFALAFLAGAAPAEALAGSTQVILLFLLLLIIFIVEIFYIKHYFFLENNIQSLYLLEDRLYEYDKPEE
ncbi:MAG: hypothetical protein LBH21_07095 [Gracilibacteraceae bacterium]|nr:hypothetical protein [Gracilibacteraceae bacterium]